MPIIKLEAKSERQINTAGRFFSVVNSTGQFYISAPEMGKVAGKLGRQLKLDGINTVLLTNESNEPIDIEYESANIEVFGTGSGAVSIDNKPVIQRIEEPIKVTAAATVENGTVTTQSANALSEKADITINAGESVRVIDKDATNNKRTVLLQNLSASETKLRVGSSTVAAGRGALLKGSINAVAEMGLECLDEIHVYNESSEAATLSVVMGVR